MLKLLPEKREKGVETTEALRDSYASGANSETLKLLNYKTLKLLNLEDVQLEASSFAKKKTLRFFQKISKKTHEEFN